VLHKVLTEDESVSPLVKQYFIVVKINIGDFSQNRDITARYDLDLVRLGVPYLMAVDSDGMGIRIDKDNDSPRMPTSDAARIKLALESAIATHARAAESVSESRRPSGNVPSHP
jgi:hypothetical protein